MTYPTWHVGDICQRMNGRNKSLGTVENTEEMAGVHYIKVRWHDTKKTSVVRADRIARDDRPQTAKEVTQ